MFELKSQGQPKIHFAKSVASIANLKNAYAKLLLDRGQTVTEEVVSSIIAQGIMSYAGRNPAPALDRAGNFQCTDLDLLSFLSPIAARGAVIEIPNYNHRRQTVKCLNERKIGSNQFGPITSLVSNKDAFSFSVKLHNKTVITKDQKAERESVGAFRNYMIVDCDGSMYDGWDKIVWDPTVEENDFLNQKGLWTGNSVSFEYYVHPNRWQSVFGAPHLLKKMLIARINDEAAFYRREVARLEATGLVLPREEKITRQIVFEGESKTIKVKTLEMELLMPRFSGSYKKVEDTVEGLIQAYRRQKLLTYKWKPSVQFVVRANEAAFMEFGLLANGLGRIAPWLTGADWQPYRKSNRHALYNRLMLSDKLSLIFRIKTRTERVSAA